MSKLSKREKKIVKLMVFVALITGLVEVYDRFGKAKRDLQFNIDTAVSAQGTLLEKLKESPDQYLKKSRALAETMEMAEEKIFRMDKQSNAQFQFQEDITKAADKAGINLNSLNKRRAKPLFKGSDVIQIKAYFGYNCPLVNLLEFLEMVSHAEYFTAVDTLNINVNSKRRRRKRDKDKPDPGITVRGSCVLATLYQVPDKNSPTVKQGDEIESSKVNASNKDPEKGLKQSPPAEIKPDAGKKGKTSKTGKKEGVTSKSSPSGKKTQQPVKTSAHSKKTNTPKKLAQKPRPLTHTRKMKGRIKI